MSLFNALNTALMSTLGGGTALTALLSGGSASIYFMQAPDAAAFDYVVFSYAGGGDANLTPARLKDNVIFVRGFSKTGPAKGGSIDAQIDALLHRKTLTVSGWTNYRTARESDIALIEVDDASEKIFVLGGMYRVQLDQTS